MKKIAFWILLVLPMVSPAQKRFSLELLAGANQSFMRNKVLTDERPTYGLHFGMNVRYNLPESNLGFGISLLHSQKGYRQKTTIEYNPTFFYSTCQVLTFFRLPQIATAYSGLEFAKLDNVNVIAGLSTYRNNDIGLIIGFRFFDERRVSLNTQVVYGFKPVLKYIKFDKYGNMIESINDLKNMCISLGLAYKFIGK